MEFEALKFPDPWPPPDLNERSRWHRLPILGWIVREIHRDFVGDKVARGIQADIVAQLEARPDSSRNWPQDAIVRRIVDALAEAVCAEKGLKRAKVALHPQDPVILLLWGTWFDDMTLEIFCEIVRRDTRIVVDEPSLAAFIRNSPQLPITRNSWFDSRRTVEEVVGFVAAIPEATKSARSVWR